MHWATSLMLKEKLVQDDIEKHGDVVKLEPRRKGNTAGNCTKS